MFFGHPSNNGHAFRYQGYHRNQNKNSFLIELRCVYVGGGWGVAGVAVEKINIIKK